ncbi:MAG: hypothetical protein MR658_04325 [Campylobacter sp.]|uniref:hypothetical protein n=1 Tax=Campylobacter sp. TaxID=205 RepID=UPI002AA78CD4|nr:hypothetical protein [Campylobacter sp.]MCI6178038.1 hypothetical protein [Campylobacter sp.]MCI7501537.1 hypothetical protein [Campylobacter sp.]
MKIYKALRNKKALRASKPNSKGLASTFNQSILVTRKLWINFVEIIRPVVFIKLWFISCWSIIYIAVLVVAIACFVTCFASLVSIFKVYFVSDLA